MGLLSLIIPDAVGPLSIGTHGLRFWRIFLTFDHFFLSAFSLNGKSLSETKNFLYFQTIEFVVKKNWCINKDEEDMEIK